MLPAHVLKQKGTPAMGRDVTKFLHLSVGRLFILSHDTIIAT